MVVDDLQDFPYAAHAQVQGCFICEKPLAPPFICWHGHNGMLFLHERCSLDFCTGCLNDAHLIRCPPCGAKQGKR